MTAMAGKRTLAALGALAVLCLGIWWGGHPTDLPSFLRDAFVSNPHDVVIAEALNDIQHDYYHPIARTGLVDGALVGAVASLNDPYATYDTPGEYHAFNNPQPQQFSGVGITVSARPTGLVVESVLAGGPAMRAGMHAGDVIDAVGGRSVQSIGSARAVTTIRGRSGTPVTLGVRRGSRQLSFTLRRAVLSAPVVTPVVLSYKGLKLGLIFIPTFEVPGIHADVAQALQALLREHVKGIVVDLRDNGGGLVEEGQLVASMFIAHGVIVTTRGRSQPTQTIMATGNPIAPTIPLVVLVNQNTASTAEIVTGALKDHHRAVIVGTRTYGKGVFQEIRPLSNGGALQVTVGQYFLPDGENLGGTGLQRGGGITPNVTVSSGPNGKSDPQLDAAERLLAARAH